MLDFEVWAIGYDKDGKATDIEEYLGKASSLEVAKRFAETFDSINKILNNKKQKLLNPGDEVDVIVEMVDSSGTNVETTPIYELVYEE